MVKQVLETWTSLYSNHAALRTGVEFLHVGGLVGGGGCAIATDRLTLMAVRADSVTRAVQLRTLRRTHRTVIVGLVVVIGSGLLMLGADVDRLLYSTLFWLKMALVALLLVNGAVLLRAERQAERGDADGWTRLSYAAMASLLLWFLTTLAGAALPNIG